MEGGGDSVSEEYWVRFNITVVSMRQVRTESLGKDLELIRRIATTMQSYTNNLLL